MSNSEKVRILVAETTEARTPSNGGKYVEAGERRAMQKLTELKQTATQELVSAIATIAQELDKASMPDSVQGVTVTIGLTVSAEFGVAIAGSGVEADVSVEFEWKP